MSTDNGFELQPAQQTGRGRGVTFEDGSDVGVEETAKEFKVDTMDDVNVNITFEDLSYGVYVGKGKKDVKLLIRGVTGTIRPGMMVALMGPSGAGKSTLLDVLAGRKSEGVIKGDLLFNGRKRTKDMKRLFGYVEQKDILIPTLTVRETLVFTARLRMPVDKRVSKTTDLREKEARAEEVIKLLGLTGCADVLVGDATNPGISGGQTKRVNAAMELITRPSILFLDEPTSGLDSSTSYDFMKVVKRVAESGVGVICTIHQPSTDIYALFDRLMLLVRGEVVYFGEANLAVDYFRSKGFPCSDNTNPAEYVVAVISTTKPLIETEETKQWPTVSEDFWVTEYKKSALSEMRKVSTKKILADGEVEIKPMELGYANGFLYNVMTLLERQARKASRDPKFFFKRVLVTLVTALVNMTAYVNLAHDESGVRNRQSLIMLSVIFFAINSSSLIAPYVDERLFTARELNAGAYSVESYYIAVTLFELPFSIIRALGWSLIIYYPCNFNSPAGNLFFFMLTASVLLDIGVGFAQLWSYLLPTTETAMMMATTIPITFLLFSGFFLPKSEIPDYWIWAFYMSFCNYGVSALSVNEFHGNDRFCFDYPYTGTPFPQGITKFCNGSLVDYSGMTPNTTYNIIVPGTMILDSSFEIPPSGFQHDTWQNFAMLGLVWAVVRLLAYITLKYVKYGRGK